MKCQGRATLMWINACGPAVIFLQCRAKEIDVGGNDF